MKRILFGLLLVSSLGALACSTGTNNNNNATPNANVSPATSPTPGSGNTNNCDPVKYGEVVVTIVISDDASGNPKISNVTPDPANLAGPMKVQWLVDNQSHSAKAQNATVEIGSFKGKANPTDTKPFGMFDCDNKFILDMIQEGHQSREISEQAEFQSGEVGYSYEVILRDETGAEIGRYFKMPEIIVGGKAITPETSPTPLPRAAPSATPRK